MTSIEATGNEARSFLHALFAGKPDEAYILVWTLAGKKSHWFRNVEAAIEFADSKREQDVYVGVGLSGEEYGPVRRCTSENVTGIVGLWADIDLKSDAHCKVSLPTTVEDALTILPTELPPTFLILTGNGVHAWWLFREPLMFGSEQEQQRAATLAFRWQTLLRANAAAHGWRFDRLADLARVLRIPGTRNCKDQADPKQVEIYRQTDRRYNATDLKEYLHDRGIPDEEEQDRFAQAWKQATSTTALRLDPSVTVPEDSLERYRTDSRFDRTWRRQREDLRDQSHSGYDLALANFGVDAGLSDQQIADLIIHNRRIHNQRPRTGLDYFHRTIAKARNRAGEAAALNVGTTAPAPGSQNGVGQQRRKPETATEKALLCEQISNALGIRILRIVKSQARNRRIRSSLKQRGLNSRR